jgi:hypothetical protein
MLANAASIPKGDNNIRNIKIIQDNDHSSFYEITTPNQFEVIEAVTDNARTYRKSDRFIVTNTAAGSNLVFLPLNEDYYSKYFGESTKRLLSTGNKLTSVDPTATARARTNRSDYDKDRRKIASPDPANEAQGQFAAWRSCENRYVKVFQGHFIICLTWS